MSSALDIFRAQQEAAEAVYARLQEVAGLLRELRTQADDLQRTDELKQLLEREERWLQEARQAVMEVRRWRENEASQFWRGLARWVTAAVFAIGAAAAAGAGYAAFMKPYDRELEQLRDQAAFGQFVEQRALELSAGERRQFDALLRLPRAASPKPAGKGKR